MNRKRLLLTIVVAFVVVFAVDFIYHGILLKGIYNETASLWRSELAMRSMMQWMLLGQALLAVMYVLIFRKGYEGKGVAEGVRFGLYLGAFMAAPNFGWYTVLPIPFTLALLWILGCFIQAIAVGVATSFIYRP